MADKKEDFSNTSYILGILSIVFGITFNPLPSIVLGIIGIILGKRQKSLLAKRGIKFSAIGIIISLIILIALIIITSLTGTGNIGTFPA